MGMTVLATGGRLSIVGHWAEIGIPPINIRAKMDPPVCIRPGCVIDQIYRDGGRQDYLLRFAPINDVSRRVIRWICPMTSHLTNGWGDCAASMDLQGRMFDASWLSIIGSEGRVEGVVSRVTTRTALLNRSGKFFQ
jgi:hypothetical protein